jgi:non-ribosomal peptide synthetase component E (peptide arylation enzyme)
VPDGEPRHSRQRTVRWPDVAAARYAASGYWEGLSLGAQLQTADVRPDTTVLVDGAVRISQRELTEQADSAAVGLRSLGLRPDDRLIVQLPNCWELVVLTLACLRLGVIPVLALPALRRDELAAAAAASEARAVIVPDRYRDFDHQALAAEVAGTGPTVRWVLVVGDEVRAEHLDARALCAPGPDPELDQKELDGNAPAGDAVALIWLSSGTTGTAKLVPRTHNDLACMAKRSAVLSGVGPDSVYLAVLPLCHGFPLLAPGVLGTLMAGGPYTAPGYYGSTDPDGHAFTGDGWYCTGDIVRRRRDGNVVVEGRQKDVINRGGEKIATEEVENLVRVLDGVRDAAAVAMPDPVLGERMCLYVVPRDGRTVELAALRTAMQRAGVARFKLPERLVLIADLPLSPLGKIDKKALRAHLNQLLAAENGQSAAGRNTQLTPLRRTSWQLPSRRS